ncbi:hypothetical protein HPB48_003130 [Haemaphysalis longicornis]|uniref:Uncharacterized protein n=1 Tax=Haemaphysalis longicornis TaxID=44386 RepID=A0A9J6H055_HAELO|nr:hypothetical protein HPB48_003130 [Haemaphysalis longicornis]
MSDVLPYSVALTVQISPKEADRKMYRMLTPRSFVTSSRLYAPFVLDQIATGKAVLIGDRHHVDLPGGHELPQVPGQSSWAREHGILLKWHADSTALGGDIVRCPKVDIGEADTLDFEHHRSIFLLFLEGNALAGIVMLVELAVWGKGLHGPVAKSYTRVAVCTGGVLMRRLFDTYKFARKIEA